MNAQFRCNPVLQQLPFPWNSPDLENNVSSGYSGSSWHLTHPQLWSKYQVWEWLQHTLDANQLDGNCIHFQDFNLTDLSTVNNAWKEDEYLFQNKYGNSINNEEVGRKEAAVKSDPEEAPDSQDVKRCVRSHRSNGFKRTPRGTHLWEFLRDILLDPDKDPGLLKWEDRSEGVFRFLKSEAVAQLWGKKKNNSSMTYEKLSRAMRYYYKREILERVDGRRLVYKFGKNAHGWRHYDQQ
ncbi:ETS homologous factor isoform X5 [Chiloscyllium plagiosum]|uniref:ETS homologous factor isoform X5 n=1 Tax=Chiloscyllium plagiosum TaxID=36176 RepID=UPI001CB85E3E|nr:ETS homologous factor isoform X5 [Chiloscyllium plagiosum]